MFALYGCVIVLVAVGNAEDTFVFPNELSEKLQWTAAPTSYATHIENYLNSVPERGFLQSQCWKDLKMYYKGLFTLKLWAMKMFDANAKPPSGLLKGHGAALGSYDQCLSINYNNNETSIKGKYCLGHFTAFTFKKSGRTLNTIESNDTIISNRLLDVHKGRVSLPWGACLPDSCSASQFRALHLFLFRFYEEDCQTEESLVTEFDSADKAAIYVFIVVAVLMITSTVYEIATYYLQKKRGHPLLRSFSVVTNGCNIFVDSNEATTLSCLYGLRSVTLVLLMYAYSYLGFYLSPLINWMDMLSWFINKNKSSLLEGFVCVDTFFVMSGVLVAYNYLKRAPDSCCNQIRFFILYFANRIVRLTPPLAMVMLLHATLLRHFGSGPVWPNIRDAWMVNSCRERWLYTLLYVQNYAVSDITDICVLQSWHLAVDMHLFILSPILLVPLKKYPRHTISVTAILALCSVVAACTSIWVYRLKGVLAMNITPKRMLRYFEKYVIPTHAHATPWLFGFIVGYAIYRSEQPYCTFKLRKSIKRLLVVTLWVAAMFLLLVCLQVGKTLMFEPYELYKHTLYIAFQRPAWAAAISWIIFACATGYGGPINSLLSWRPFEVLSKVSYSTYVVNLSVMFMIRHQTRTGYEFSDFNTFHRFLGDAALCIALGLVWNLAFESPFISITKILSKRYKDQTPTNLRTGEKVAAS